MNDAASAVIQRYQSVTQEIWINNRSLIENLVEDINQLDRIVKDLVLYYLDDIVDEIKGCLGVSAENISQDDDDPDSNDHARQDCEEWVDANVSNADIQTRVLCVLDRFGVSEGARRIRMELAGAIKGFNDVMCPSLTDQYDSPREI